MVVVLGDGVGACLMVVDIEGRLNIVVDEILKRNVCLFITYSKLCFYQYQLV
jgi:hypothetical protein